MKIPIASDAWRFVIPLVIASTFFFWLGESWAIPLAVVLLLASLFCLYFFRDFNRDTQIDPKLIYSPGDGKILEIAELKEGPYKGWTLIRIFLSVLDGHVQRSPMAGQIEKITYKKGVFLDARDPNAHLQNEQSEMVLSSSNGTLVVTQIAGLIARRIVCWMKPGEMLQQGERYGLIRFGSQVDVVMPSNTAVRIQVGDRVFAGLTVLAEWKS